MKRSKKVRLGGGAGLQLFGASALVVLGVVCINSFVAETAAPAEKALIHGRSLSNGTSEFPADQFTNEERKNGAICLHVICMVSRR